MSTPGDTGTVVRSDRPRSVTWHDPCSLSGARAYVSFYSVAGATIPARATVPYIAAERRMVPRAPSGRERFTFSSRQEAYTGITYLASFFVCPTVSCLCHRRWYRARPKRYDHISASDDEERRSSTGGPFQTLHAARYAYRESRRSSRENPPCSPTFMQLNEAESARTERHDPILPHATKDDGHDITQSYHPGVAQHP